MRARLEDGAAEIAGLGDDLDVVLGLEHVSEARADDRVVVDDEDADRHRDRDLDRERRARTGRRLDLETPVDERDPLAHAEQAEAVPAGAVGRIRDRRPRSPPTTRPSRRVSTMLTCFACACLTTFVSASWVIR